MSNTGSKRDTQRTQPNALKRGDRVTWNSEAGWVSGIIQKKITSPVVFKGYTRHASKREPQYFIKSDKTDHIAVHKGSALTKIPKRRAGLRSGTSNTAATGQRRRK